MVVIRQEGEQEKVRQKSRRNREGRQEDRKVDVGKGT